MTKNDNTPELLISPRAYSKIRLFQRLGDVEVGGIGIGSKANPLYIEDFVTVLQESTVSSFEFDDDALGKMHYHLAFDKNLTPDQTGKVWIHTHPCGPSPSGTDMQTQEKCYGNCDWSVMCIIGSRGEIGAKLFRKMSYVDVDFKEYHEQVEVPITGHIAMSMPFVGVTAKDIKTWEKEYAENVKEPVKKDYGQMHYKQRSFDYANTEHKEPDHALPTPDPLTLLDLGKESDSHLGQCDCPICIACWGIGDEPELTSAFNSMGERTKRVFWYFMEHVDLRADGKVYNTTAGKEVDVTRVTPEGMIALELALVTKCNAECYDWIEGILELKDISKMLTTLTKGPKKNGKSNGKNRRKKSKVRA